MNKKTIILVLIVLLILNTLFWINLLVQRIPKMSSSLYPYTYGERLERALRSWELSKGKITLLIITNAILVAISFMIILLYKNK